MSSLSLASIVTRSPQVVSSTIDGEVMLMHAERGQYYGAASVAGQIWTILEGPMSVEALCQLLVTRFKVPAETCQTDVLEFLQDLELEQLIEVEQA